MSTAHAGPTRRRPGSGPSRGNQRRDQPRLFRKHTAAATDHLTTSGLRHAEDVRRKLAIAVASLAKALDIATEQTPSHALRRGLIKETLDESVRHCETFVSVTAAVAIAGGDHVALQREAHRLLPLVAALDPFSTQGMRLADTTHGVQGTLLTGVLSEPKVHEAVERVRVLLTLLAGANPEHIYHRHMSYRRLPRQALPGTVVASALTMVALLAGGVSLGNASRAVVTRRLSGAGAPVYSVAQVSTQVSPPEPSLMAPRSRVGDISSSWITGESPSASGLASPAPVAHSVAWPIGVPSTTPLTVSALCGLISGAAQFTICNASGSPVTWTAVSSDPDHLSLGLTAGIKSGQLSATLVPGSSVTVYVEGRHGSLTSAQITVFDGVSGLTTLRYGGTGS